MMQHCCTCAGSVLEQYCTSCSADERRLNALPCPARARNNDFMPSDQRVDEHSSRHSPMLYQGIPQTLSHLHNRVCMGAEDYAVAE